MSAIIKGVRGSGFRYKSGEDMPPVTLGFGDPIGGGFYAGMIWNQLGQTSTAALLSAGSKTFNVTEGSLTGVTYTGQMLEIRSRANPNNHFKCTVVSSSPSSLTVSVDSIAGGGTFSDWSIMGRYRVIVAPKSSGEHDGIKLKTSLSAMPDNCRTLTEGWLSTTAMYLGDTSAIYPAAHWARGLSINGYTDWYIPARDELELCWRNLKPSSDGNYAGTRYVSDINYGTMGSYDDRSTANGTNLNSWPVGTSYSSISPGQTPSSAFQVGGSEAFAYGSATWYWASSEASDANAWYGNWQSLYPGFQDVFSKTSNFRVRAIRRSLV